MKIVRVALAMVIWSSVYSLVVLGATFTAYLLFVEFVSTFETPLFFGLMVLGAALSIWSWLLAHFHILFTGLCFLGVLFGVLVDRLFRVIADRYTTKRKREWNFGQHESTHVD